MLLRIKVSTVSRKRDRMSVCISIQQSFEPLLKGFKFLWPRLVAHATVAGEADICTSLLQLLSAPLAILVPHLQTETA